MKQFIVLIATVALGIFIVNLVAGPDDVSLKGALKGVWKSEITRQQQYP